jgi:ATP-dependent Clp protease ATP-binding subunit ClpC
VGKVNVYLPDELERAVRDAGVPVSAVCQAALRAAVDGVASLRRAAPDDRADGPSVPLTPRLEEVLASQPSTALDLLGAIVLHGENLGARVLRDLGVELPPPQRAGRARPKRAASTGWAPDVREVLVVAYRTALELGHGYLGTEHVVVALAREDAPTATLFAALGLDDRAVQGRVVRLLTNPWRVDEDAPPPPAPAPSSDGGDERLDRFERELQRLATELRSLRRTERRGR